MFCYFLSFQDCLRACREQIEQALHTNLPQATAPHSDSDGSPITPTSTKCANEQPTTPTDVRDVHY